MVVRFLKIRYFFYLKKSGLQNNFPSLLKHLSVRAQLQSTQRTHSACHVRSSTVRRNLSIMGFSQPAQQMIMVSIQRHCVTILSLPSQLSAVGTCDATAAQENKQLHFNNHSDKNANAQLQQDGYDSSMSNKVGNISVMTRRCSQDLEITAMGCSHTAADVHSDRLTSTLTCTRLRATAQADGWSFVS